MGPARSLMEVKAFPIEPEFKPHNQHGRRKLPPTSHLLNFTCVPGHTKTYNKQINQKIKKLMCTCLAETPALCGTETEGPLSLPT